MRRVVNDPDGEKEYYFFVPHLDFIESGRFQFPENDYNMSPFYKYLPVNFEIEINEYRA